MTTPKRLFSLQELDLVLDRIQEGTGNAARELDSDPGIEALEAALLEEKEKLERIQSRRREQRLDVESQKERSSRLDDQLYGGAVTNPRDLESMEQEATHARDLLKLHNDEALELEVQAEEAQTKCAALEKQRDDNSAAWETRRADLQNNIARWALERDGLLVERADLTATLDQAELKQYEVLRLAKKGLAVAKVERGLCQACRMSLPTHQVQKVRTGRQTVLCNSCGRILFLS